jgi:translation initiation factor IF-3
LRKTFRRRVDKPVVVPFKINRDIRSADVRLIDEKGENIGVVSTAEALQRAESLEMDLVEVSPLANPPVAKILNFHAFKYQHEKEVQRQKARQKKQEMKGVRLSLRIGQHDQNVRLDQARRFLADGDKLKVELPLRGRENQHADLAGQVVQTFIDELKKEFTIIIEQPLQKQGGRLSLICTTSGRIPAPSTT